MPDEAWVQLSKVLADLDADWARWATSVTSPPKGSTLRTDLDRFASTWKTFVESRVAPASPK